VAAVAVASGVTITVLLRACSVVCVTIGCDVMTGVAVTAFGEWAQSWCERLHHIEYRKMKKKNC